MKILLNLIFLLVLSFYFQCIERGELQQTQTISLRRLVAQKTVSFRADKMSAGDEAVSGDHENQFEGVAS
jgi:hypothetical protein